VYAGGAGENYEVLIKHAFLAPIWTRIAVTYIVFFGESDGGTPGAQFLAKRPKN